MRQTNQDETKREREIIKITKSVISTYAGVDIKLDLVCVVVRYVYDRQY